MLQKDCVPVSFLCCFSLRQRSRCKSGDTILYASHHWSALDDQHSGVIYKKKFFAAKPDIIVALGWGGRPTGCSHAMQNTCPLDNFLQVIHCTVLTHPDSQYLHSQYPHSQYQHNQYPRSQYPHSQYPHSQYPMGH